MATIKELLANASDFDLCCGVWQRIVDVHGEDLDALHIPAEHRTVLLVWHAMGIIGNGGFNYLFENSFSGDPYFALTAESLRAIGCKPAAEAFQKALDIFPNAKPPTDIGRRLTMYRQGGASVRRQIDTQFWDASKEIDQCAAKYIRSNRAQFESLDSAKKKPVDVTRGPSMREPSELEMLIAELPHWARVAYAARCARRVFPIFHANWPEAPPECRAALVAAILAAENSAANAQTTDNAENAELQATCTAGRAMGGLYGVPDGMDPNVPPDGNAATLSSFVANAAGRAVEAAMKGAKESYQPAIEAASFAVNAAGESPDIAAAMRRDLVRLLKEARTSRWSDSTAVPPSVFDQ